MPGEYSTIKIRKVSAKELVVTDDKKQWYEICGGSIEALQEALDELKEDLNESSKA